MSLFVWILASLDIICCHGNHHLPAPAKMYSIYGHTRGPLPVGEVDHMLLRSSYVIVYLVVWILVCFVISMSPWYPSPPCSNQDLSHYYMEPSGTTRRMCLSGPPRRELTTASMLSSSHRQQPTSLSVKMNVLLQSHIHLYVPSAHNILQYYIFVKDV